MDEQNFVAMLNRMIANGQIDLDSACQQLNDRYRAADEAGQTHLRSVLDQRSRLAERLAASIRNTRQLDL